MHPDRFTLCHIIAMRRTSLEIDEERLARAQRVLGTTGIKDTVDRALEEVVRASCAGALLTVFDPATGSTAATNCWMQAAGGNG